MFNIVVVTAVHKLFVRWLVGEDRGGGTDCEEWIIIGEREDMKSPPVLVEFSWAD